MSFDGTKWKQHTPIDDDNYMIEISYSSKTRMLATSTSKCKHKAKSPTSIEYSQYGWYLHWGFPTKPLYVDNMIKSLYVCIYKQKDLMEDIGEIIFHKFINYKPI